MKIPLKIVNEHNQVLEHWQKSGLKKATLLHIDAHHDIVSIASKDEKPRIDNFICLAVDQGIVSHVYWLNPHSTNRRLQDFGLPRIYKPKGMSQDDNIVTSDKGEVISEQDIEIKDNFILDIDLDAFCCSKNVNAVHEGYDGTIDWQKRVDKTIEFLSKLRSPDLITIARSVSKNKKNTFIPKEKAAEVEAYLLEKLGKLYEKL